MFLPYYLSGLGMGGGLGVLNPVAPGGYGRPQRLVSGGFGGQPASEGDAALAVDVVLAAGGAFVVPVYAGSAALQPAHAILYGESGIIAQKFGTAALVAPHALAGAGSFAPPAYAGAAPLAPAHPLLQSGGQFVVPAYGGVAQLVATHPLVFGESGQTTNVDGDGSIAFYALVGGEGDFAVPAFGGSAAFAFRPALSGGVSSAVPAYVGAGSLVMGHPVLDVDAVFFEVVPQFVGVAALVATHPAIAAPASKNDVFVFRVSLTIGTAES